jgi:hypothetical protein
MLSQEQQLLNYIEALKKKLLAAILENEAEALCASGPFSHYKAIAKALEKFGLENDLLEEEEEKKEDKAA